MPERWRRSPQQVDPLSWFAGPQLPILLSVVVGLQSVIVIELYWTNWTIPAAELVAVPFFVASGLLTARFARVDRRGLGVGEAGIVLAFSAIGIAISGFGATGGSFPVEQWWAAVAMGVTLAALAPYSSARHMIGYAIVAVLFVAVLGAITLVPTERFWPPFGTTVISCGPVIIAGVAGIVFSRTVVGHSMAWLNTSAGNDELYEPGEPLVVTSSSLARTRTRVTPFLERVAASGVITAEDRALAAQIARGLRTELVTATSRSWLDVVAHESGIIVSDPGQLADSMNDSQRAALRGLLVDALDSPIVARQAILIELRAQPDGSTAVALSIDVDLPEGRRLMLLAPYYLTLKTTVDDLSWDDGNSLLLRFRIPPSDLAG